MGERGESERRKNTLNVDLGGRGGRAHIHVYIYIYIYGV